MERYFRGQKVERITQVKKFVFKCNVTVYDAYFLALSRLESKPFVTADYKFTRRIKGFKDIVNLTEI